MIELYRRIWRVTGKAQILLIILSIVIAALAAVPLRFQKDIINGLSASMDKQRLILLCLGYFGVLVLSAALKFAMRYRSSTLSESVIRRIREKLFSDRAEIGADGKDKRGTLVSMIAAEAEEVGRFAGGAIASPILQIGTLVSVVAYIAATQPFLGLFMLGVILPQAIIVLTLQKFVNQRVSKRIQILRQATGSIAAAEDMDQIEQTVFQEFDQIYKTRCEAFKIKLSIQSALTLINGAGAVGILLIGGLLFLNEQTDIGTVVASLTAMSRINDPWRELIAFYRELSAVRVKFELLLST